MINNAEDLKNRANEYKTGLKKQYVNIPIGDEEYGFRISGIGAKSIESGNDNGLEALIKTVIEEYEEEEDEE